MNVFCYYHPVDQIPYQDELALIKLWKKNWNANGIPARVLCEADAQHSDLYQQYKAKVSSWPSINPKGYDYSAWMRLLAVSTLEAEMVVVTDYDTFNYGWQPHDLVPDCINLFGWNVPCCMAIAPTAMRRGILDLLKYDLEPDDLVEGRSHFADQQWIAKAMHHRMPELFNAQNDVLEYSQPGWQEAKLVHYCNKMMRHMRPRHEHIWNLRSW